MKDPLSPINRSLGIHIRLPETMIAVIDRYSTDRGISRSESIRQLLEVGINVKSDHRRTSDEQKRRASELAGDAIDQLNDTLASLDDQDSRKQRLLKGPEEFQSTRLDRSNRS